MELANSKSKNNINLLIGSDFYLLLATGNVKFVNSWEPVAVETTFGWVIIVPLKGENMNGRSSINFVNELSSHQKSESLGLENKLDCF